MNRVGVISGGFDPIHSGHIAYINAAKANCDYLIVGVNSDAWLERKKGRPFMPYEERVEVVKAMGAVDEVIQFDDEDGTARDLIKKVLFETFRRNGDSVIFMNGGDRTSENIPEQDLFDTRLGFMFGVGGENKANSSSWILEQWQKPQTERIWGHYRVVDEGPDWKVKELTVLPGKSLSDQQHEYRTETWTVVAGECKVDLQYDDQEVETHCLYAEDTIKIDKLMWHRLYNDSTEPVKIVEIWHGETLTEEDIQRR